MLNFYVVLLLSVLLAVFNVEKDNDDDDFTNQREKFYNSENDVGFEDDYRDGFEDDDHGGGI